MPLAGIASLAERRVDVMLRGKGDDDVERLVEGWGCVEGWGKRVPPYTVNEWPLIQVLGLPLE